MVPITPELEQTAREMGPQSTWSRDWPKQPSPEHALLSHSDVVAMAWGNDSNAKLVIGRCFACAVLSELVVNTH